MKETCLILVILQHFLVLTGSIFVHRQTAYPFEGIIRKKSIKK